MSRTSRKGKTSTWRGRLRRTAWLFILAWALTSASIPPERAVDLHLAALVDGRRFDWVGWEVRAVWEEVEWWLGGRPVYADQGVKSDPAGENEQVLAFLEQRRQIAELEDRIRNEMAQLPQSGPLSSFEQSPILPPSLAPLERELLELQRQQQGTGAQVERIMAAQVNHILADEGLARGSQVWPPVTFRFNDLPTYLVISPRDEIRVYRDIYLLPDVPEAERAGLEAAVEARLDVSALVVDVGGIGSWPTMVIGQASLPSLFDIVAHEWTHTYLLLRPLGMHYGESRDLTTLNETVASVVGGEVADLVMARYYPELAPPPVTPSRPLPEANDGVREDFNQAMRRIRLHVDELLAEGRVTEAEAYMEAERQKLVATGYNLRRLNQAYFAFHGSYATSPASVDPIGPWVRQLRAQSGSLQAFLDQAARMRSLDDLLQALGK